MRIVYGVNPVLEVLRSRSSQVEELILSDTRRDSAVEKEARRRGVKIKLLDRRSLDRIAGTTKHQGVVALVKGSYRYCDTEDLIDIWKRSNEAALFLILDSIEDPQNMGTLIRSAYAAGVHGVIIPKDRSSPVTPAVVKASAGATEHTPIARVVNLRRTIDRLKREGVWVVGVEAGSDRCIYDADLTVDIALVIGSEAKGIRRLVKEGCDLCVEIPMTGRLSSLNAAQAGAVALFEARRQRLAQKLKV